MGHEAIRDASNTHLQGPGTDTPESVTSRRSTGLPSLRTLLLGSRFTLRLSKHMLYLDALSGLAARGDSVNDL